MLPAQLGHAQFERQSKQHEVNSTGTKITQLVGDVRDILIKIQSCFTGPPFKFHFSSA